MATIAPAQAQRVVIATAHPRRPSRPRGVRLWLDQLESRVLLSAGDSIANAVGLSFLNTSAIYQTAHATEYLADAFHQLQTSQWTLEDLERTLALVRDAFQLLAGEHEDESLPDVSTGCLQRQPPGPGPRPDLPGAGDGHLLRRRVQFR